MTATEPSSGPQTRKRPPSARPPRSRKQTLNPSQMRDVIPAVGLREYWYPLIPDRKLSNRHATKVKLLNTELAVYRDKDGNAVAVDDACPHRGASLSKGKCHFKGTLTCPYHGWTFDGEGECVAVLGEGPESRIPGMGDARARVYPTRTLKGLVFVWMGDGEPVPIEHDVPPQFFDDAALVQHSVTVWNCNWRPAFENILDAHVFYVHRNSFELLFMPKKNLLTMSKLGPRRPKPNVVNDRGLMYRPGQLAFLSAFVGANGDESEGNGSGSHGDEPDTGAKQWPPPEEFGDAYPGLSGELWPKMRFRPVWHEVVGFIKERIRRRDMPPPMISDPEWHDAHLPATYQVDYNTHIYTRSTVPINAERSRIFYYHTTKPETPLERAKDIAYFRAWKNWSMNYQFSGQDEDVVEFQHYDTPEKFSATDTFPLGLRRLIVEKGRDFLRAEEQEPEGDDAGDEALEQ